MMNFIMTLINPAYWIQNNRYSKQWDEKLKQLMVNNRFENVGSYTAEIGGITVWIENHPYASFVPYGQGIPKVRPSRATIRKAMKKLEQDQFEVYFK